EREELAHLLDDPRARRVRFTGLRLPERARIDRALGAHAPERRAVRRLVLDAEHLVDELMRELVPQHLDDLAPRPLEDQRARELDGALGGDPAAEHARVGQAERRRFQTILEELATRQERLHAERMEQRSLELGPRA